MIDLPCYVNSALLRAVMNQCEVNKAPLLYSYRKGGLVVLNLGVNITSKTLALLIICTYNSKCNQVNLNNLYRD